ncbi:uncharacterized protein LOC136087820 isoform X2 [Hydra vulgaris]|uniref:Uncharacterized protein LOC136087820 isoform X2 n=1 Tax=Hydra vulgaris TaxID=6087 RepID=A0ABM4CZR2_HYDVU
MNLLTVLFFIPCATSLKCWSGVTTNEVISVNAFVAMSNCNKCMTKNETNLAGFTITQSCYMNFDCNGGCGINLGGFDCKVTCCDTDFCNGSKSEFCVRTNRQESKLRKTCCPKISLRSYHRAPRMSN